MINNIYFFESAWLYVYYIGMVFSISHKSIIKRNCFTLSLIIIYNWNSYVNILYFDKFN